VAGVYVSRSVWGQDQMVWPAERYTVCNATRPAALCALLTSAARRYDRLCR
jgi:hypothetical protein